MEFSLGTRLRHAWNAFTSRSPTVIYRDLGPGYSFRPDRTRFTRGNERSIVTSIYNRIAMDVAQIKIRHVDLDDNGRFLEERKSDLNNCLSVEANADQTARAFIQDVVVSMFDEGCVAMIPYETTSDPMFSDSYDICSLRVGQILEWFPDDVRVRVYNDRTGRKEEKIVPKRIVGIVENPFYAVMNEPNSTLQRLIRKLALLDAIDDRNSSGKLNLIIQLPYTTHSPVKKEHAQNRLKEIENQLISNKYGIAYADSSEHIVQLNRPLENNLMAQIEYLTSMLYSQLGITQSIMDESADEKTMLNYNNRILEPIVSTIVDEMRRKFLSKTARSRGQSIAFFIDPFKLVPITQLAEISDKLTRNEIATPNEIRQIAGMKPSKDPKSDELRNRNLNESKDGNAVPANPLQNFEKEE